MGSSSSKFKKYLQHGDEYAAMQVYQSSPELRRDLDPNCRHGVNNRRNSISFRRRSLKLEPFTNFYIVTPSVTVEAV